MKMTLKQAMVAMLGGFLLTSGAMAETLKVGTEGAYPPFNQVDNKGKVSGLDVDMANAVCAKMKVTCEFVVIDWDGLIPALNMKKFDFIAASMSITDERKQAVDFSDHYYSNVVQFIAPKDSKISDKQETLKGKNLGAQRSTLAGIWLEDHLNKDANVKLYDNNEQVYMDLTAGRLDAVLADKFVSWDWINSRSGKNFEFKGEPVEKNDYIGFALRKGDDKLKARINDALKEMIEDGTYKKINEKYFPFDIY